MTLSHAVFYEPGHFHAALTLRMPNPRLAPDIHVYATPGPERDAFLTLVEHFNTRADCPTHWRLHLHDGAQLLQRLVEEGHGDFVVVAGRNDTKLETIASLTQAGLPVLADKPWLTESRQLPYLAQVTTGPCVAMDLMTGPYSLRAQVMAQVVHTPELFGTFVTDEDPHTYCTVNPQDPGLATYLGAPPGKRGDPVWFAVMLTRPASIARIVFRHGAVSAAGGWFDTTDSLPRIEVARTAIPTSANGAVPDDSKVRWEVAGLLDQYPRSNAVAPPALTDGQSFELRLAKPLEVYGIRVVGKAGGDYASCAELSAYG